MDIFNKTRDMLARADTPEKLLNGIVKCSSLIETGRVEGHAVLCSLKAVLEERAEVFRASAVFPRLSGVNETNVSIYSGMSAYLSFLHMKIGLCQGASELQACLRSSAYFLGSLLAKPRGGMLTAAEIECLLEIVQHKFGLISAVTNFRDLDILMINRSHTCYDSFLMTCKNTVDRADLNKWMLFCLSPCLDIMVCNRYFVFLHEIGHILYNALTEDSAGMPEFFGEVVFLLGFPDPGSVQSSNMANYLGGADELFADIFSAAALSKTRYSDFNPYNESLSGHFYEFLDSYFAYLSSSAERKSRQHGFVTRYLQ